MKKIFNDPVYGFVEVPHGILLQLIDHPWFQRLRRIRQLGMSSLVYPGALHTRFHHALGALHLMQQALETLQAKQVHISAEEAEAACIAILLHDIGHGPYSHALEHTIIDIHHEDLSLLFMQRLNEEFKGQLNLAIDIFTDRYPKKFLRQLVSGQLDMDRMDYLNRDSFFTGVSEGVIGYDRIIKMLAVHDGELVVEEKGIYSIEKFLIARRLMYWQVYLHKTSVSAELMLIKVLQQAKRLTEQGKPPDCPRHLKWFLELPEGSRPAIDELIQHFSRLDDHDVMAALKTWSESEDFILRYLSDGLLNRRLNRLVWLPQAITGDELAGLRRKVVARKGADFPVEACIFYGKLSNQAYNPMKDQIKIKFKDGQVLPLERCSEVPLFTQEITKYYVSLPK